MGCLWAMIAGGAPRLGFLLLWAWQPLRFQLAFGDSLLWPILGVLFLPLTTLIYVLVAPGGVSGIDWLWLALAFIADLSTYGGAGYVNRDRLPRGAGR